MADDENRMKTGTTTVAIKCRDGVVLAADKRATAGTMIANKWVDKIFTVEDYMAITTAGTVSDVQLLLKLIKAEIRLKRLRTGRKVSVKEAANLLAGMVYSNIRKLSTIPGISHFLFAGKDETGFHVYDIYPDGSMSEADDYLASGSGSVFAFGVLETLYKDTMHIEEGRGLALKALNAALQRDSASGNGVDLVTITDAGVKKILTKKVETGVKE
ncbi:proteasome subunit beta [Candidatus Woesearchaeota archaeon]|nr:proteasome subunit beta [Candidatus Woesearchaeota archaeon]